jgi:hypothetical protein
MWSSLLAAVMAAVVFLGEDFSFINGVGLVVLICGVALFNYTKYQRIVSGEAAVITPSTLRKDSDPFMGRINTRDAKAGSGDEEDFQVGSRFPATHFRLFCQSMQVLCKLVHLCLRSYGTCLSFYCWYFLFPMHILFKLAPKGVSCACTPRIPSFRGGVCASQTLQVLVLT